MNFIELLTSLMALRYSLSPEHWDNLKQQHDGILIDIKEHLEYCKEWQKDTLNSIDYATWQNLYNELSHRTKQ